MVISLVIEDGGIGSFAFLSSSTAPVVKSWMNAHFATVSTGPSGVSPGGRSATASFDLPLGGRAALVRAVPANAANVDAKARRRENVMSQSPAQAMTWSPTKPTAMA